jgi:hypothetical protein
MAKVASRWWCNSARVPGPQFGPYMALSCSARWPFPEGPGCFWVGLGEPDSVAIA